MRFLDVDHSLMKRDDEISKIVLQQEISVKIMQSAEKVVYLGLYLFIYFKCSSFSPLIIRLERKTFMRAIIPVAGVGSRLRPHTYTLPKVLLNVAGKPILGHILDELVQQRPDHRRRQEAQRSEDHRRRDKLHRHGQGLHERDVALESAAA
mgnify:CR=1 FL=1